MGRFGENAKTFFEGVYNESVPWEVGQIQPELLKIFKAFPPSGNVLDIGCGSGDTAIDIARLGYNVVGIDFVDAAIENAKVKLMEINKNESLNITYICGNGLQPSKLGVDFGAIVDSGFMHLFNDDELYPYIEEIRTTLAPNGRVYLIEFSYEFGIPKAPRAIAEETIRFLFEDDKWKILSLKEGEFINKVSPVPAVVACIEKKN